LPNVKPSVPSVPTPNQHLWSLRKEGVTWSAELRYHAEHGVEAQILRQGELVIGRRFDTSVVAVQWADNERRAIDAGL
jgi:hypothetical protein